MRNTKLKSKNGITLIALVITIIVMLILVAVTITIAVNGGLFEYAEKAAKDTETAKQNELKMAEGKIEIDGKKYDSLKNYIEGIESDSTPKYSESLLNSNGVLTKTAKYTDTNNEIALIPAGFGIVDDCEIINQGLVISDEFDNDGNSTGNEFIWIPVSVNGNDQSEKEASFDSLRRTKNDNNYVEPALEDEIEYNLMRTSVINNGGFYIARYEAGYSTTEARTSSNLPLASPLSKKGAYPYNYVNWNDAKSISQGMYTDSNVYGVKSTLCYGVQWDLTLLFLDKIDETDSSSWGNYVNTGPYEFSGNYLPSGYTNWKNDKTTKEVDEAIILQTGATNRNSCKKIYDLAGNITEWTMEKKIDEKRVLRSGYEDGDGSFYPANFHSYKTTDTKEYYLGFRVTLYIS